MPRERNQKPTASGGISGPFVARRGFDARGHLGTNFLAPDLPTNLQNPSGDGTVVQSEYFWDHASFIRWDGRVGTLPNPMTEEIVTGEQYAIRMDFGGHELGRIAVWDGNIDGPAKPALAAGNIFGVTMEAEAKDAISLLMELDGFILGVESNTVARSAGEYVLNSSGGASAPINVGGATGLVVPDGSALLWLGDTRLGQSGWGVVAGPAFQFAHTGAAAVGTTPGNWRYLNVQSWLKKLAADADQPTDTQPGDLQTTLEQNAKELKVFANGAWQKIYSEVDVKAWIAALSLFEGTVKDEGSGAIGAVETHQLPDLARLSVEKNLDQVSHYWTWVGKPNYEVKAEHQVAGLTGGVPQVWSVPLPNGVNLIVRVVDATTAWAGFESLGTGLTSGDTVTIPAGALGTGASAATFVLTDVDRPGTPIIGRDLAGAVLNPGDWVQIANRGTVTAPDLRWVTVGGDLLAKSRGDNLYGLKPWVAGGWEKGSLTVYEKTIWRATSGVTASDTPPGTKASAGPPVVTAAPWEKVDLASGVRWVSTDTDRPATAAAGEIYFVLQSAEAGGAGALYYYDSAATKWVDLSGSGGIPLDLSGGKLMLNVGVPIGCIMAWPSAVPPEGWLICNGSTFAAGTYPELSLLLRSTTLPDLRGMFLRGYSLDDTVDKGGPRAPLSTQEDATANPKKPFTVDGHEFYDANIAAGWSAGGGVHSTYKGPKMTWDGGDPETRPKNVAVVYIIKALDSAITVRN